MISSNQSRCLFKKRIMEARIPGAGSFGNMKTTMVDELMSAFVFNGACLHINKLCAISFS